MPLDKAGKFHINSQKASHGTFGKVDDTSPNLRDEGEGSAEGSSPVHEHLTALHAAMGGKHMHVHSDGMFHTSHQVGEDGKVEGPHDHENIEALKEHMGKFFDEEEQEGAPEENGERDGGKDHHSLYL
jgi:hypothetical protein